MPCSSFWESGSFISFFQNQQRNYLAFAGLIMAIATYIRSETLILACLMVPAIVWYHWKNKTGIVKGLISSAFYVGPSVVAYIISISIYINRYLPAKYNIGGLVNKNLGDLSPFFTRFSDINSKLIFRRQLGVGFTMAILSTSLFCCCCWKYVIKRKLSNTTRNWLYAVLVIYIGFPLMGYLLPLLDLNNSTKRVYLKYFR